MKMDLNYIITWASKSDVCRCCLAASGTCDMTVAYFSDSGVKEIYLDMLEKTFGISLLEPGDTGSVQLICALCVAQLRLASAFKKQVLQSERHFDLFLHSRKENFTKSDASTIENNTKKADDSNITVPTKSETIKTKVAPVKTSRNIEATVFKPNDVRKHVRKKRRIFRTAVESEQGETLDPGYDSDTPIAELAKLIPAYQNKDNDNNIYAQPKKVVKDKKIVSDKDKIDEQKSRNKNHTKISERKRVMLTCGTVLRDTTACPFRHHKSWFQCFFCFQDFMEINPLRDHTLNAHGDIDSELKKMKCYPRSLQIDISNLKCRHCCLTLTDVNAMRRHFVDVHNKVIYNECIADYKVDSSPYTCHICKREFHVFRTLTTHLNEHYPNCICDVCGKSFLNTKRLKVHKRTHESGIYPCEECGKVLKTKISKANHMETHCKRIIKCQICFKPMKHYNARIKHMSEEHNITHKFKCPICSREYNIKHYLATHIRQTHGHKNKKCTECDMAFITNHGLKKHMLKHTGEKPYTCTICCKSYARSYTLREHMRAHDADKRTLRN